MNQKAAQLYQQYTLTADDPELAEIVTDGTPEDFLDSIRVAGKLKARRTKGGTQPPADQTATTRQVAARAPGVAGGGGKPPSKNPIANINSTDQLLNDEWKAMRQAGAGRT